MFNVVIVLLSFNESLVCIAKLTDRKKCLFLKDEQLMVRPTILI